MNTDNTATQIYHTNIPLFTEKYRGSLGIPEVEPPTTQIKQRDNNA
jgi:hypothetical protein